jgi:hypothetical protein
MKNTIGGYIKKGSVELRKAALNRGDINDPSVKYECR